MVIDQSLNRLIQIWRNWPQSWQDRVLGGLLALLSLALRLPGLNVFLTADEPKSWFGRSIQFLEAIVQGKFINTFDSPAPGVTTMWAGAIGLLLDYLRQGLPGDLISFLHQTPFDPLDPAILPLIRLPIVLIAALTVGLTYIWGRPVFGSGAALLAAILLALDPFLLALSRILGHDGLVTMFMWLSLLAFLRAGVYSDEDAEIAEASAIIETDGIVETAPTLSKRLDRRMLVISGLLGGLAFLTKYPALFLGAFIAIIMLILYLRDHRTRWSNPRRWTSVLMKIIAYLFSQRSWGRAFKLWFVDILIWSAAAGAIGLILWPAMWVDPLGRVMAIINDALRASSAPHQKGSFFLGEVVADPGMAFYLIVTAFKTTLTLWLGWLLGLGIWVFIGIRDGASRWPRPVLIILAYALLYGLLVSMGGKKQDRYILPAFPALAALAAIGYVQLSRLHLGRWVQTGLFGIVLILQVVLVLPHFPYYFTYYNPVMGGGEAAAKVIIVGWGEGMDEAARWLNTLPGATETEVVAWYSTTFEPYYDGQAIYKIDEEKISRSPKPGLAADYVVFYINQLQRQIPSEGALQHFQAVDPVQVIRLKGTNYAWIYPSIGLTHVIAEEARLVGQAELQGFNLRDQAGNLVEQVRANETWLVELYWEWQGKDPDEPIRLSLVDESGQTWGWGTSLGTEARLPFETWKDGMVARDDFALSIFPGTPPGDYYLSTWIDRPATGEIVGHFPLDWNSVRLHVERPLTPPALADFDLSRVFEAKTTEEISLVGLAVGDAWEQPWPAQAKRDLSLVWQANRTPSQDYDLEFVLNGQGGQSWPLQGGQLLSGRLPASDWQAGDIFRDPWTLLMPAYMPPGDYELSLRVDAGETLSLGSITVRSRLRNFTQPAMDLTLHTEFADNIILYGLQGNVEGPAVQIRAGRPLSLTLVLGATGRVEGDYTLTVQVLNSQNEVVAQRDAVPLEGQAPTYTWTPGEVLSESVVLDLPESLGPGPYQFLIAFYQPDTGARLARIPTGDHFSLPVESGR